MKNSIAHNIIVPGLYVFGTENLVCPCCNRRYYQEAIGGLQVTDDIVVVNKAEDTETHFIVRLCCNHCLCEWTLQKKKEDK